MITNLDNSVLAFRAYSRAIGFILLVGCSNDLSDDPIFQPTFSDVELNLALPDNFVLQSSGGYKLISQGVRGIILYRKNPSAVLAFERNCSYHPNDACATVEVHSAALYMTDLCCGSNFRWEDGAPTGGPAWRPLQQYSATLNGNTLTVTDQVIN